MGNNRLLSCQFAVKFEKIVKRIKLFQNNVKSEKISFRRKKFRAFLKENNVSLFVSTKIGSDKDSI